MDTLLTTITPDAKVCGQKIKLSPIDQIAPRDYNVVYSFFPLEVDASKVRIFQELEVALSNTAKELPQICSVIQRCQNNRGELELEYNAKHGAHLSLKDYTSCSGAAQWPHGSFADLKREHFPMTKLERHLLLGIDSSLKLDKFDLLPGLYVQANFIEGGLILSSCLHHTICDGTGVSIFHTTFAREMCRVAGTPLSIETTSLSTLAERTTLVTPVGDTRLQDFPDWKLVDNEEEFLDPVDYSASKVPIRYSIYFISEENIRRLRARMNAEKKSNFSPMDTLSAFLWMHVLRARMPDPSTHPTSKLSITVDSRTRMTDCPVPGNYWGNFSEPNAVACLPTSFFLPNSTDSDDSNTFLPLPLQELDWCTKLPLLARKVQSAIRAVNNTAVRRLVSLLSHMPRATSLTWNVNRWPGPDMLIVCCNKLPLTTLEYGNLGFSEASRITVGNTEEKPDGRCILLPSRRSDGRGMEVALQYDLGTLERLRGDGGFGEYFEWRN